MRARRHRIGPAETTRWRRWAVPRILRNVAEPDVYREQLFNGFRQVWTERPDGACIFVPLIGEGGFED